MSEPMEVVPEPKECHFCICGANKKADIPTSISICGCPCHWQNAAGVKKMLEAVKFFFGKELREPGKKRRYVGR